MKASSRDEVELPVKQVAVPLSSFSAGRSDSPPLTLRSFTYGSKGALDVCKCTPIRTGLRTILTSFRESCVKNGGRGEE